MMVAIKSNSAAMVELLLRYEQIDLDAKTKDGKSFVHLCVGSIEGVSSSLARVLEDKEGKAWDKMGSVDC